MRSRYALEQIRQQHEAISFRQQHQQLGQHGKELRLSGQLCHGAAFARRGHGGIQERLLEIRVRRDERDKVGELGLDLREIDVLLERDLDEGAGVAGGCGSCVTFEKF